MEGRAAGVGWAPLLRTVRQGNAGVSPAPSSRCGRDGFGGWEQGTRANGGAPGGLWTIMQTVYCVRGRVLPVPYSVCPVDLHWRGLPLRAVGNLGQFRPAKRTNTPGCAEDRFSMAGDGAGGGGGCRCRFVWTRSC